MPTIISPTQHLSGDILRSVVQIPPSILPPLSSDDSSSPSTLSSSSSPSPTSSAISTPTMIDTKQNEYSLMTHAAIAYASERLSDPSYTTNFHTVNVFDFDQTLFQSPLPNPALWDPASLSVLTSWNYCGTGWWHNPGTLELGPEIEANCWEGWWNEHVVQKVKESSNDPGCLTLLLTGRNGPTFSQKVIEMAHRKGLEFDLIATKPTTVSRIDNDTNYQQHAQTTTTHKSKKASKVISQELYLKIHTFNTKHDLLYNILFEFPSIRSMHLWDDRPCQISMFRQVGQEWLDKKLLDRFEVTAIQEPLLYMDPQREIDMVMAMVEANNKQADIEASGGPFLVPGVGPLPRTRPELANQNMWDPYETYTPQIRSKIEITKSVRYTGVMFSDPIQKILREKFGQNHNNIPSDSLIIERPKDLGDKDLSKWVLPDEFHVTLCLGPAFDKLREAIGGLGATVFVEVEAVGQYQERIWALKVKEYHLDSNDDDQRELLIIAPNGQIYTSFEALRSAYGSEKPHQVDVPAEDSTIQEFATEMAKKVHGESDDSFSGVDMDNLGHIALTTSTIPHITMAYDRLNGSRAVDSKGIQDWRPLTRPGGEPFQSRLILVGTIGEKNLLGMKTHKVPRTFNVSHKGGKKEGKEAGINFVSVINGVCGEKGIPSSRLEELIGEIREEMDRLLIENKASNTEQVGIIAQEICERAETLKG
ncbi:hypothetical protein BGZ46_009291 [Entomortierella lignicola]|nr:hypothetical protein BGZ46_009291 [Entomortierella lignicola]